VAKKRTRVRHQPRRTCIACRQTNAKRELVRVVRQPDGQVLVDPRGKLPGRGAYICKRRACWQAALQRRQLGPALKIQLTEDQRAALWAYAEALPDERPDEGAR
jgi:predicted RNA-binding protein YlxR (DUF448 family)